MKLSESKYTSWVRRILLSIQETLANWRIFVFMDLRESVSCRPCDMDHVKGPCQGSMSRVYVKWSMLRVRKYVIKRFCKWRIKIIVQDTIVNKSLIYEIPGKMLFKDINEKSPKMIKRIPCFNHKLTIRGELDHLRPDFLI